MNHTSSPAAQLKPHQRPKIALRVLTKKETVSGMAEEEGVSRKFWDKDIPIGWDYWVLSDFRAPDKFEPRLMLLGVAQWLSKAFEPRHLFPFTRFNPTTKS